VAQNILASARGQLAEATPRGGLSRQPEPAQLLGGDLERGADRGDGDALGRGRGLHRGDLRLYPAQPAHHGLHIRWRGRAPRAARFSGVNPNRLIVFCLGLSGALAGLAGIFEVTGPAGQISIDFNVGYGFTAIIVAFLGRLHPIGILLAGLLMALTYIGGELAQFMLGLPAAAIQAFQGMLLFFLLAVRRADELPHPARPEGRPRDGPVLAINPVLLLASLMVAATPILLAASANWWSRRRAS
jgi:hypothetical protein